MKFNLSEATNIRIGPVDDFNSYRQLHAVLARLAPGRSLFLSPGALSPPGRSRSQVSLFRPGVHRPHPAASGSPASLFHRDQIGAAG